jgi:hypothetical protein
MSPTTLSNRLKEWIKMGLVARRVDESTYPPTVYYRYAEENPFQDLYANVPLRLRGDTFWKDIMKKADGKPQAQPIMEAFVTMDSIFFVMDLLKAFKKALTLPTDEETITFIKTMLELRAHVTVQNYLLIRSYPDLADVALNTVAHRYSEQWRDMKAILDKILSELNG